jgi:hypothetical protein
MVVVRKSAVSTRRSTWFRHNTTLPVVQPPSRSLDTTKQSLPTLANEPTTVRPIRKRNPSRNLSVSPANEVAISSLEKSDRKKVVSNIQGKSGGRLPIMSTAGASPIWLLRLQSVYRYSSAAAFLVVAATLVVYGWTVYSQELWGQTYRTLQSLQRNERQLITTNATLTSKMAEEAEQPAAGLVSPNPGGTIFLPPVTSKQPKVQSSPIVPNAEIQPQTPSSLGY